MHDTLNENQTRPFEEKIVKLLEHWIKHNNDHSSSYIEWANKMREHDYSNPAKLIEEATESMKEINQKFQQVIEFFK